MSEFRSNIIFVHGGKLKDVQRVLEQWIDAYFSQMNNEFVFRLYRNGPAKYVIVADEKLENDLFYFLVNYIKYPVGIDYEVEVEGFTTGTERNILKGKDLFVFLPEVDREFDYVLVSTGDGESYRVKFNGKITDSPVARIVQKPVFIPSSDPKIFLVDEKKPVKKPFDEDAGINTRMKWLLIALIVTHVFNFLIIRPFSIDKEFSFESVSLFLSVGTTVWFYYDYTLLKDDKRYLKCLSLSIGLLIYLYSIDYFGIENLNELTLAGAWSPVVFLLIQWPLRFLYIRIFNKEPIIEYRANYLADFIYGLILPVLTFILVLIFVGLL